MIKIYTHFSVVEILNLISLTLLNIASMALTVVQITGYEGPCYF